MDDWLTLALPVVQKFEGCRLHAYPDPATGGEPFTIGWGHTGHISPGTVWTQQQADDALGSDLRGAGARVDALVLVPLEPCEMAALASLVFNIGIGNFRASTLLRLLNAGAAKTVVARQFLRWDKAAGHQMRGLTLRRAAERALFLGKH